ncbi:hypothetical protein SAMN05216388_101954 [Halorientalis persicus]|uniref:Polysaccharide deacetylase n=1 Tax=Halorientalis persicus TaxID=1367881 RepID=A0A1H8SJ83_9EURY|nr:hypothetical protein [Halorientalis persicus]SEO78625.1 hypothetical protein SAMN05216388_101954 [Halorientalis persicus]
MSRYVDFTYPMYGRLLDAGLAAGYEFLPVREYLTRRADATGTESPPERPSDKTSDPTPDGGTGLPERLAVLRHDMDRKPRNALAMARIEAERGVESTYYVRTIDKTFRPTLIERIAALGHEIGYHYEDLDRADGDPRAALASFERELGRLRGLVDVETVCMHGNPLSPHDNRDLWEHADPADYDLLGEAYLSLDFTDVTYFSDTGRTWRDGDLKVKDHTMGEGDKRVQVDTTPELAGLLLSGGVDRVCLLSHPNRWAGSRPEWLVEGAKDAAINAVKRGLTLVSS